MDQIETTSDGFILYKNKTDKPIETFKFKDVTIEWGLSPSDVLRIRSLHYPNTEYSLDDVKEISKETVDCLHCKTGHPIKFFKRELVNKDQGQLVRKNMAFNLLQGLKLPDMNIDSITSYADQVLGEKISTALLPQTYAQAVKMATSLTGSNLGKKALNGAIGLGGLLLTYFMGDQLGITNRMEDEINIMAANLLNSILDVNPEAGFGIDQDLQKLKAALQFGDPNALMNAFYDPSKISLPSWGNMGNFSGGNILADIQKMFNFGGNNMLNGGSLFTQPTKPTEEIRVPINPTIGQYNLGGRWS
jgi:hypothetical protein